MTPNVYEFFDPKTFTYSYVVVDPDSQQCAVIDSVLDYDPASGRTSYETADKLIEFVVESGLQVEWILETHVHADHLSAAPYIKQKIGGKLGIGDKITVVQDTFGKLFNAGSDFAMDGSQFDHLFADQETFTLGGIKAQAIHTPGHTPACMAYVIGNCVFVGDTLFMPDYGTARCDFPGGDAATLYHSIQKLFALPDETRVFMCHDYKAPNREEYLFETTIGDERLHNIHVKQDISEQQFVEMREGRDATLNMPTLILPSVQVNMRAGELPPEEDNGVRYLKIPLNKV
ncbi:MBL fold metallo-hydrolase [Vibrio parahaemolyticus]|jgi:glyoxylase-like metal-dependent hydrolase (beta-lactamase superfamily II)|uniref:MBL fold metallo-hydrolase n=1 Tax=Vibrio TaxID=662 RepID=UPI00193D4EE8|nr:MULTISPECIES: MBL fold metallo-hydrolase [Vibrio]MBM5276811.1 MBL fold metallo-hydrolase [Vibrio parahaemolyticus]MCA2496469.1 MBL fold metallo-hydrolase [Vibrio alginolyticus]MCF9039732.1 MBL fold metallo-hydrolase [Vibrio parahaemolyticus]MCG6308110.1 MBL fold metallo-hydrolase [Vibrio alginolyticus]MDW2219038.1 MBL fold metallo-hydrolase [Vibrio sp. 2175-1]